MTEQELTAIEEKRARYAPILERIADRLVDGKPVRYNANVDFSGKPFPVGIEQEIEAWIDLIACGIAWIARKEAGEQ